ncbi:hypothetical protein LDENG_00136450 [Lucifuga dentata]|nr:hypothetical protein LDENG_00136450 [Lucifuga dentata]
MFSAQIAAASCCFHAAQSSNGALSEMPLTLHLQEEAPTQTHPPNSHPPFVPNTYNLLTDTVYTSEDNRLPVHALGTLKPLPVLLEAFIFKRIAATVFKSLIL